MPDESTHPEPGAQVRLSVLRRDGTTVLSRIHKDPEADVRASRERLRRLWEKAAMARSGDTTPYGHIDFMGRRHISSLHALIDARHRGAHVSMWVENIDGQECTACACGVLVPGRVGTDFTEEQFGDADGHVAYGESQADSAGEADHG